MSSVWSTDYLWREIQGAKLASLFGLDQEASQGNESFQFTAPKQPRKVTSPLGPPPQKPAPPPPTAPAVLLATAVQAFQLVNGQYVKHGRVGAAILGNHNSREYKLLLYGSQQKQITTARIHLGFSFTVQPDNYGSFYDDQKQNWSLMFDSEKAEVDFCKEVCVSRRNSEASVETVVFQELFLGEGRTVKCGDTVLVAFSAWLLQNQHIGQMFDCNIGKDKLLRVKLGAGRVIKGLEGGLLGMKKGGRRLIIVPPSLGYGLQGLADHVPPSSSLVYEVEIHRVKFAKDTTRSDRLSGGSAANSPSLCRDVQPQLPPSIPTDPGSQPSRVKSNLVNGQPKVKFAKDTTSSDHLSRGSAANSPSPCRDLLGLEVVPKPQLPPSIPTDPGYILRLDVSQPSGVKSNSINEQPKKPEAAKAKLIFRMAKMGQPMLPFLTGAIPAQPDPSDSETEAEDSSESHHSNPSWPSSPSHVSPQPVQVSSTPHLDTVLPQPSPPVTTSTASLQPAVTMETSAPQATVNSSHGYQPYPHFQCSPSPCHLQPIGQYLPPHPITYQAPNDVTSFLMTEARQHTTEIRLAVGRVSDKVEQLADKIEDLQKQGSGPALALASMPMETAMVLHNIQRITQENVRLKKELLEKSSRLEEQYWKIGELMDQNQRHMEQNSLLLEQRSEVLKSSSWQSQNHLLQAEQNKVHLAEKLASSSSVVCELQQQNSSLQQRVSDLQSQLSDTLQDVQTHCSHNSPLENQLEELKAREERGQAQWQMEKQRRKESELRLTSVEEELNDLRAEYNNLQQTLSDRKRKWQQEHQRLAEELEEVRASGQQEIDNLQLQLRKARTGTEQGIREQLKRVMNGLFHSLRGEFDQHRSYQGGFILGVILKTIKRVTLALLAANTREEEEEEEEDEDQSDEEEEGDGEEVRALWQNGTTQGESCQEDEDGAKTRGRGEGGVLPASHNQTEVHLEPLTSQNLQTETALAPSEPSTNQNLQTETASAHLEPLTNQNQPLESHVPQPEIITYDQSPLPLNSNNTLCDHSQRIVANCVNGHSKQESAEVLEVALT